MISMTPLDTRILDIYELLTPLEQRLANVVLEHQRELASYSATELARAANVSKATAARLFKRLGYASYNEARRQSRALRYWGSPLKHFDDLDPPNDLELGIAAHLRNEIANLTRTFEGLESETVARTVAALARADRICLLGFRGSHPLAELASFWAKYLKNNIVLLPSPWMTFAEDVIALKPGDAVLAIGMRRRPRMFRALLEHALDFGATVILLTDLSASGTAKLAHFVIRCHSRSANVFDSYATAVSMVNYLLGALALQGGEPSRPRLERIEEIADQLDAFTLPEKGPASGRRDAAKRARAHRSS
jgi:DNA-binding MurR/RpiR family transcriptional regulator